jgi:iron transport multicopper oxidase
MPGLTAEYLSNADNPDGNEPEPYSALMNDAQNITLHVKPKLRYLIRIINMSAFSQFFIQFDQHELTYVGMDGIYLAPGITYDKVYITTAQRYAVILQTKNNALKNYAIAGAMDETLYDEVPSYVQPNVTGYLIYNTSAPLPPQHIIPDRNFLDDFSLYPYDHQPLFTNPVHRITLNITFATLFGQNRYFPLQFLTLTKHSTHNSKKNFSLNFYFSKQLQ